MNLLDNRVTSIEVSESEESVELLPGNYMAFFKPWDSGGYDT